MIGGPPLPLYDSNNTGNQLSPAFMNFLMNQPVLLVRSPNFNLPSGISLTTNNAPISISLFNNYFTIIEVDTAFQAPTNLSSAYNTYGYNSAPPSLQYGVSIRSVNLNSNISALNGFNTLGCRIFSSASATKMVTNQTYFPFPSSKMPILH